MDRIVDHVLAFEGDGKIKEFVGNFSEYRENLKSEEKSPKTETPKVEKLEAPKESSAAVLTNSISKKKLSFKEQHELETIEKEMPKLEEKRNKILEQISDQTDYDKIAKFSSNLKEISEKLENLELRWLELQEN
jgi:ATP-binding cassette subfamily F protein uup